MNQASGRVDDRVEKNPITKTRSQYDEVLHYLKLESVYYSRSTLGGQSWGVDVPAYERTSMFHIVTNGNCIVEINDKVIELTKGDVIFISRACGHSVKGSLCAETLDLLALPIRKISDFYETLDLNENEAEKTIILCGVVKISHPAGEKLIEEMPDVIRVEKNQHLFGNIMDDIVDLMFREASGEYLGGETVITRLADVLMIQAIRYWVANTSEFNGKWLRALKDEKIGKALARIHSKPEQNWTIETLGSEVGMSRTAFANKFKSLVGETVLNYITRWRINLAAMRIKNGERVDLDFIESLGYQSESAFRRTFKKVMGSNISEFLVLNN